MINWILQKNLTKPAILERIKSVLNGKEETWEEVAVIPFSNDLPTIRYKNAFNIVYGSTTFMLNAFKNTDLRAGVFYDPTKFHMNNYVAQWKENVLNADGQIMKFGELTKLESIPERKWFLRPNDDGKGFSGRIDSFQELLNWSNRICKLDLPELNRETEIWIAAPKAIKKEWRLFIVDDEIVSVSRYMNKGVLAECELDRPKELMAFAKERIAEYRLADIYVMDIAETENTFKLIECNCFNGTGFYKHNVENIIQSVNRFIKKQLLLHS